MSNDCPTCKEEGRLGFLSCYKDNNSDCWFVHCTTEGCDYMRLRGDLRKENIPVAVDRRKKSTS